MAKQANRMQSSSSHQCQIDTDICFRQTVTTQPLSSQNHGVLVFLTILWLQLELLFAFGWWLESAEFYDRGRRGQR